VAAFVLGAPALTLAPGFGLGAIGRMTKGGFQMRKATITITVRRIGNQRCDRVGPRDEADGWGTGLGGNPHKYANSVVYSPSLSLACPFVKHRFAKISAAATDTGNQNALVFETLHRN
jgi:hypothetical protein